MQMAIRIVRLGEPRRRNEGIRLGTVRRPPRGVPKRDFATRDFFDAWLPELAPSPTLVAWAQQSPWTDARWREFGRRYRKEMAVPQARHLIDALAALSRQTNFAVGCYCEDSARCHRALLRELLVEAGATVVA
jgi:uncharacterized protein YeaO (DUF488 family)